MSRSEDDLPILIVDDEPHILTSTRVALRGGGVGAVETIDDSRQVLPFLSQRGGRVILLDLIMPHCSGMELLPQLIRDYPEIPVIVMTASDQLETAVECMKTGAFDYLVKPVEKSRLLTSVRMALELHSLRWEVSSLKQQFLADKLDQPSAFSEIITNSKKMRTVFQYLEVVARSPQPILVHGETGTGKELIAKAIHTLSGCPGRFVAVNLAGLDDQMFSDTLFGHTRGAFTGANQLREGLITSAAQGTLFLDEIGDLHETSQVKLLRLLQEHEYYPVGSDIVKKCNARVVAATNRVLEDLVAAGRFRNDLYFRLCAHQVKIPPLRERLEDIPLLADHFLAKAAQALNREAPAFPQGLLKLLSTYDFPGNIRELEALVLDAVARTRSGLLSMDSFRFITPGKLNRPNHIPLTEDLDDCLYKIFGGFPTLKEAGQFLTDEALRRSGGKQGGAATLLGITRQALNKRLKRSI